MGFSHSFIATRGIPKEQLLEQLGLTETGETGDIDLILNGFGLSEWTDGWLVIGCDDYEFPMRAPLAALSAEGEDVYGALEEHVNSSEAAAFAGGNQIWRVTHSPEEGIDELHVEGAPPAVLAALLEKARAEERRYESEGARVDVIFDVPLQLAASLCDFEFGRSEGEFVGLARAGNVRARAASDGKPGFLARLFGRR